MWQSRIEIENYSVTYFDHIATLNASYCWTSNKGGAHIRFVDFNWFDRESNGHKWRVWRSCRVLACRRDQTGAGRPISQHVSNNWSRALITFCHTPVWPRPFISLLLRLEGPIGLLFTPIPSTQKRSFPSKRSTLWNTCESIKWVTTVHWMVIW